MKQEHAERYTGALSKVIEGAAEFAELGEDLAIPRALGITRDEWLSRRLQGTIRLTRKERQEVHKVLTAPKEEGGEELTQREAAKVTGSSQKTVSNDVAEENYSADHPDPNADGTAEAAAEENYSADQDVFESEPPDEPDEEVLEPDEIEPPAQESKPNKMNPHLTSVNDEWETPQDFFDAVAREFKPELDVCALPSSAKCGRYFTPDEDGLQQEWTGVCWMNPPYGDEIVKWMKKAHEVGERGGTVVCLVPARPDTGWWWTYCRPWETRFIRGRLKFGSSETSAPFPSALVICGRPSQAPGLYWEWRS